MHPILLTWGGIAIPSWHALFVIGAFAAYALLHYLFKTYEPDLYPHLNPIYLLAYTGGYWGARALSLWIEEDAFTLSALTEHGSMTFYGGFIGALSLAGAYVFWKKLQFLTLWDLFIPACLLGLSIGRVGCFLNGDDFGIPVISNPTPWWAVTFPNHELPIPRVPVQLIESLSVLCLLLILLFNFKKIRSWGKKGIVGHLGLGGYCCIRFFDEYLRGDDRGWFITGLLTPSQGISLIFFLAIVLHYFSQFMKKPS